MIQEKKPHWLPKILRNWEFLPRPLHSLEPYDKFLRRYLCCCKKFQSLASKIDTSKVNPINEENNEASLKEINNNHTANDLDLAMNHHTSSDKPKIVVSTV